MRVLCAFLAISIGCASARAGLSFSKKTPRPTCQVDAIIHDFFTDSGDLHPMVHGWVQGMTPRQQELLRSMVGRDLNPNRNPRIGQFWRVIAEEPRDFSVWWAMSDRWGRKPGGPVRMVKEGVQPSFGELLGKMREFQRYLQREAMPAGIDALRAKAAFREWVREGHGYLHGETPFNLGDRIIPLRRLREFKLNGENELLAALEEADGTTKWLVDRQRIGSELYWRHPEKFVDMDSAERLRRLKEAIRRCAQP